MATEIATFAAGCFWCYEAIYDDLKGVTSVESGYIGGHVANPTYKQICNGDTGHVEVVRIDSDRHLIAIRGSVPGAPGGDVVIRPAAKA